MADEDLIFRLEGVGGDPTSRAGDSDADSDEEEGYFICPITDDPGTHQNVSSKVHNYYSNLTKSERYGSSGSPASSFHFKVSGPPAPPPSPPPPPLPPSLGIKGGCWRLWWKSFLCVQTLIRAVNSGSEGRLVKGGFCWFHTRVTALEWCFVK